MKIAHPEGLQPIRPEKVHPKKDSAGSAGFNDVLREALSKPEADSGIQKTSRLSEPLSIQGFGSSGLQTVYVDKTSRVIDLMDKYASSLSNPRKTLKDIEPELKRFIEEAQSLHEEYVNSGNADTELEQIMEDLLRAARLEGVRFQRGDYLEPE